MPSGDKPIKDIKVGDEVFSLDETGAKRIAKVVDMVKPKEMPVVNSITIERPDLEKPIVLEYTGESDKKTIINPTNHSLNGVTT